MSVVALAPVLAAPEPATAPAEPGPGSPAPARDSATVLQVLYFAALRDLAGTGDEQVSVTELDACVSDLLRVLEARHEGLRGRLASVRVAVNEEFVELSTALRPGDVVALIPPVSGG